MSAKKPALGRGLDALLAPPPAVAAKGFDAPPGGAVRGEIPIDQIRPNPFQPRTSFDPDKIRELAESIRSRGLLQPILVRARAEGAYEIIAGERRWRAAQQARLRTIPAMIREFDDKEMLEAAVIENVQRDDLNAVEEARSYERLTSEFGTTQEALSKIIGKSRVAITNALRLLRLPQEVLALLETDALSAGHARALLALPLESDQLALARKAVEYGMSVREVERAARGLRETEETPRKPAPKAAPRTPEHIAEIQDRLREKLGLKVRIVPKNGSTGKIEIFYGSIEDFQTLCSSLGIEAGTAPQA